MHNPNVVPPAVGSKKIAAIAAVIFNRRTGEAVGRIIARIPLEPGEELLVLKGATDESPEKAVLGAQEKALETAWKAGGIYEVVNFGTAERER